MTEKFHVQITKGVVLVRTLAGVERPTLTVGLPSSNGRSTRHCLRRPAHLLWRRRSVSTYLKRCISHGHIVIEGMPCAGYGGATVIIPWRSLVGIRVALRRRTAGIRPRCKRIWDRGHILPIEHAGFSVWIGGEETVEERWAIAPLSLLTRAGKGVTEASAQHSCFQASSKVVIQLLAIQQSECCLTVKLLKLTTLRNGANEPHPGNSVGPWGRLSIRQLRPELLFNPINSQPGLHDAAVSKLFHCCIFFVAYLY